MYNLKKGLDIPISGSPDGSISDTTKISHVGVLGPDYVGMKPTMMVETGDKVNIGSKLFEDKKNPGIFYTSPATGTIKSINRGDKRRFISIEIEVSDEESQVEIYNDSNESIIDNISKFGVINNFRTRPFNKTPKPNDIPEDIFINLCDTNPLSVDPYIYLRHEIDLFNKSLLKLKEIFKCNIHVCYQNNNFDSFIDGINYHIFNGPHPAGLSGTHIHFIKPVDINSKCWYVDGQGVLSFGDFAINNKIRTTKYVSIGGPSIVEPKIVKARIGSDCRELVAGNLKDNSRLISGSILNGYEINESVSFLGFYHNQISAISDEIPDTFFNWLMPGSNLHSKLGVFISSWIKPDEYDFNTALNGSNRGIVPVAAYEEVMPLNIMSLQLLKSIVVKDIENAIKLGVLELAPEDLSLCSYVCPSKYDYCSILSKNLELIYKELQ